jgi:hypothetical protein
MASSTVISINRNVTPANQRNAMASGQPKEIHTPEIGDRIRVAMYYDGLWRPLVWIRVGGDGSIYTGVLVGSATEGRIISKPAQNPSTEIRFSEGRGGPICLDRLS